MIDLHIHSNYSDGTSTIEELLENIKALNLSQFSITDHNIIDGSIIANKLLPNISVVGTELSVDYKGFEIHLLAYFPNHSDYKNVQFIINEGEAYKKIALVEMIENLNNMGFNITLNELSKYTKGVLNRVHICMALMDHGYIESISDGFDKYIGEHCDAYVERKKVLLSDAIDAIHRDGGIAIIAHPFEYKDYFEINSFLEDVIDKADGIECFHPSANEKERECLKDYTLKHHKIVTGGSDFHGKNKPNITINMMGVKDVYKIK